MDKIAEMLKATHIDFDEIPFKCELDIPCPGRGCFNCILALIEQEQQPMVEALREAKRDLVSYHLFIEFKGDKRTRDELELRVDRTIGKIDAVLEGEGK